MTVPEVINVDGPKFQFVLGELIGGGLEKSVKEALGKDSELLVNRIMENVKGGIVQEICQESADISKQAP